MDIKVLFGAASVGIAAVGYVSYLADIFRRRTKPHAYSWLVWSAIALIGFLIQFEGQGGPGSWLLGVATASTFSIFVLSLFYGHKDITVSDRLSLAIATVALVFLIVTDRPLISAVLITSIEAVGAFFPTFRKSYKYPYQETVLTYATYALSIGLSLLALENYALSNILYPSVDLLMYVGLVTFLLVRRTQVKKR
jgi:hypothetical protein